MPTLWYVFCWSCFHKKNPTLPKFSSLKFNITSPHLHMLTLFLYILDIALGFQVSSRMTMYMVFELGMTLDTWDLRHKGPGNCSSRQKLHDFFVPEWSSVRQIFDSLTRQRIRSYKHATKTKMAANAVLAGWRVIISWASNATAGEAADRTRGGKRDSSSNLRKARLWNSRERAGNFLFPVIFFGLF